MRTLSLQALVILFLGTTAFAADPTPQAKVKALYTQIIEQSPNSKDSLTTAEINKLADFLKNHPVAGPAFTKKYDHQPTGIGNGEIGFCFGRAMTVHLGARRMGLSDSSIQKIFIAGNLKNNKVRWRFHMATLVRDSDRNWRVVDPVAASAGGSLVSSPGEWMTTIKNHYDLPDGKDESKFYVTTPDAIMVDMSVIPATLDIEAHQDLLGDRLINVTFDPIKPGFDVVSASEIPADFPLYRVSGDAKNQYFVNVTEPLMSDVALFDFDFFRFSTVILLQPDATSQRILPLPRSYDYNNYFVDLMESLRIDKPLPELL